MISEVFRKGRDAKEASYVLAAASTAEKNQALAAIADGLVAHETDILAANAVDLQRAKAKGMASAMVDRLTLTKERIAAMAEGVRQVIALPDPAGVVLDEWDRPNGLHIRQVSVPLGVIAIIYESRPNVTVDAAVLCVKAGNACVLRGGSEAIASNTALAKVIRESLAAAGLPADAVNLIEDTDRALVKELLTLRRYIDLAIPRGGAGLIRMVVDTATVPCIETGSGVCHVYVDKDADLDMAVKIVENAKVSRPSTCNAMETLLVHRDVAQAFLKKLAPVMKADGVELRQQANAEHIFLGLLQAQEYVDLTLCNPPFHASADEASSGSMRKWRNLGKLDPKRQLPVLNFGGQAAELWCPGGEAAFLKRMASESAQVAEQVLWFSSLVSKGGNVELLQGWLARAGAVEVRILGMSQGQKQSRLVAWTFKDGQARCAWRDSRWR